MRMKKQMIRKQAMRMKKKASRKMRKRRADMAKGKRPRLDDDSRHSLS